MPYPYVFVTGSKTESAGTGQFTDYTKSAMQTVRIPLAAFGVVTTDLEAVEFRFGTGNATGEITLDDVTYTD